MQSALASHATDHLQVYDFNKVTDQIGEGTYGSVAARIELSSSARLEYAGWPSAQYCAC